MEIQQINFVKNVLSIVVLNALIILYVTHAKSPSISILYSKNAVNHRIVSIVMMMEENARNVILITY